MARLLVFFMLAGCARETGTLGNGESCVRSVQCQAGLACVSGICTNDLSGLEGGTLPPREMDAGMIDAGMIDAGPMIDAGRVDAGRLPDAGMIDAGRLVDAGMDAGRDAGPPPFDAGMDAGTILPPIDAGMITP